MFHHAAFAVSPLLIILVIRNWSATNYLSALANTKQKRNTAARMNSEERRTKETNTIVRNGN